MHSFRKAAARKETAPPEYTDEQYKALLTKIAANKATHKGMKEIDYAQMGSECLNEAVKNGE